MVSRLFCGAADQIRTGDLILTKDALYRLSYNSIRRCSVSYYIETEGGCQAVF